jgi:hypothetical protein
VFAPTFPYVISDPQYFREDFAQDLNPKLPRRWRRHSIRGTSRARRSFRSRRMAHAPVVVRGLGSRSCDRPRAPAIQAGRAGSTTVEFDDASHAGALPTARPGSRN